MHTNELAALGALKAIDAPLDIVATLVIMDVEVVEDLVFLVGADGALLFLDVEVPVLVVEYVVVEALTGGGAGVEAA